MTLYNNFIIIFSLIIGSIMDNTNNTHIETSEHKYNNDFLKKNLTCATVLITQDKKNILFGKITLQNKYDLPKGKKEYDESDIEAASRELNEETGIFIPTNEYYKPECKKLFQLNYNKEKDISLFFIYDKNNVYLNDKSLKKLSCSTYFKLSDYENYHYENIDSIYNLDDEIPEIDDYKLLNIEKLISDELYVENHLNKSMSRLFKNRLVLKILNKFIGKYDYEEEWQYENNLPDRIFSNQFSLSSIN